MRMVVSIGGSGCASSVDETKSWQSSGEGATKILAIDSSRFFDLSTPKEHFHNTFSQSHQNEDAVERHPRGAYKPGVLGHCLVKNVGCLIFCA